MNEQETEDQNSDLRPVLFLSLTSFIPVYSEARFSLHHYVAQVRTNNCIALVAESIE